MNVQWVCPKDGGYKTGRFAEADCPNGLTLRPIIKQVDGELCGLIQHSCTNQLEFVPDRLLKERPSRSSYEPDPTNFDTTDFPTKGCRQCGKRDRPQYKGTCNDDHCSHQS